MTTPRPTRTTRTDHRPLRARRPAPLSRAGPARGRRAAVGHPPLLRHPGHDARRHQPGRRRARLRHAAADHRGRRRAACAPGGPTTRATTARSSCAGRWPSTSSGCTACSYDPERGDPDHGRGLGGGRPGPAGATCDPGDEVILHEPSYVAYIAGGRLRRRRRGRTSRRTLERRLRPGPGGGRGGDHAAHQGALPGLPVQPHRRRPRRRDVQDELAGIAVRHDLLVYSDEIYDRLVYGDYRHRAFSVAARHARPDHPHGRLLQGLRHDRLAGRLAVRPARHPRGHRQGPPVRDHVGPDDGPGRGAGGAQRRRARRAADGRRVRPPPAAARGRLQRHRACRRSSRAAPSTPSREITSTRPDAATEFSERLLREERVAVVPGDAFGPSGEGHVRACYATSYEQLEEALVRIERFVEPRSLGRARATAA